VKQTGIPVEIWRYYLLSNRPETADSDFLWQDFKIKNNNELLPNLGNFINRVLKFCYHRFNHKVPIPSNSFAISNKSLIDSVNNELKNYIELLENVSIKEGLKVVMSISRLGNQYMQEQKVWDIITSDPQHVATVIYVAVNLVKLLSILLEPYMPSLSQKILHQLNHTPSPLNEQWIFEIPGGHVLNEPQPLIRLLSDQEISKWQQKFGGRQQNSAQELFPLDLRIGKVVTAEPHPDPTVQHLLVLTVDLGNNQTRQVVSALRGHYNPQELIDQYVVLLSNLKPSKFKGVLSQGMLLTAEITHPNNSDEPQQIGTESFQKIEIE
jgi:methionyl-tRNA synthetase